MTAERVESIKDSFCKALDAAVWSDAPYRHCFLSEVLPQDILSDVQSLTFPTPDLGGVSGARELHNDQRHYFNAATINTFPFVADISAALQSSDVAKAVAEAFDAEIDGTFLRVEYAQDVTGFWLQPHTDIGVKRFTMLIYISDGPDHDMLGTDIYADKDTWAKRTPFSPNIAMAFKPGDNTWHGFEPREINGVRKSLILNYVTTDWRDREQLAFPDQLVRAA